MKKIILAASILLAQIALANQTLPLECDMNKKNSKIAITVNSGDEVKVIGHEFMSGHRWVSLDGLESETTSPAPIGGRSTVEFTIQTRNQNERTKTYKFEFKRSWENKIVSKCSVSVTRN